MQKCIICGVDRNQVFSEASEVSIRTVQSFSQRWAKLGAKNDIYDRLKNLTYNDTTEYYYHRTCYMSLCHQGNLLKAEKRYEECLKGDVVSRKRGRPSTSHGPSSSKSRKTFDHELCVFCQSIDRGQPFQVRSDSMGSKFLQIKEFSNDDNIRARLSLLCEPRDAFAQDIKYHTSCLRVETKNIDAPNVVTDNQCELDATRKAICDIEIVNIIRAAVTADEVIDMNSINNAYIALLNEYNVVTQTTNYKQYLKSRLLVAMPELQFVKRGPKPEVVFSKTSKDRLLASVYENTNADEEMKVLSKASQIIRREIESMNDWQYTGSFDDFNTPQKLIQLVRWITYGSRTTLSVKRETEAEKMSRNLSQHIISSYRSRRQVMYESTFDSGFQKDKKTPWNVGLALTSYQANRSRSDVETLHNLKLATTYDEVERMTTRMAMAVIKDVDENNHGVHAPPFVKQGVRPLFAIDNIDWGSEAGPFHGADLLIAQREGTTTNPVLGSKLNLNVDVKERSLKQSLETIYSDCDKPTNPIVEHQSYNLYFREKPNTFNDQIYSIWLFMCSWVLTKRDNTINEVKQNGVEVKEITEEVVVVVVEEMEANSEIHKINKEHHSLEEQADQTNIGQKPDDISSESDHTDTKNASETNEELETRPRFGSQQTNQQKVTANCPTWSTFNSIISKKVPVWNVGITAPLYRRSPTEWPVLLTILMQAQKINCLTVGEDCRPIISLDGDLYDRAVKLKNYKEHWCIRLGALHTTMAALKCLGKYTEGSGIDLAWEESGLYGSATVRQIIEGRHVYRGIEAHTVTLVALYHLLMQTVFNETEREELAHEVEKLIHIFDLYHCATGTATVETFQDQIFDIHKQLSTNNVFQRITEWEKLGKGIQKFFINYMHQVQVLLMFIGGTRKADWRLHLSKLEELLPYFHAHDQYNYGRWGPLYLADMLEMQTTDVGTWQFLDEGNFTISKHDIPFTSIDPDHAIEQEHKKMKAKGGFVGITGNERALDKYFIIAPVLSRAVNDFKEYSGIESRQATSLHHELKGKKSLKMMTNAAKLIDVLTKEGNPFQKTDMFNLVTFVVTSDDVSQTIEKRDQLGKEALDKFVTSRLVEKTVKFWDPQKKNNFSYFKDVGAVVKTKIKGQLVSIKQERKLLSRLLVVAKSRPEFALKDVIGNYEFNSTPPSNFHPDGRMIMLSGKSKVMQSITELPLPDNVSRPVQKDDTKAASILIIDGMCVVNMVKKVSDKFNASDFASEFVNLIVGMSKPYDEVRLLFDQYLSGSLKESTRDKRTQKTTTIHYHVNDNTEIKNIKTFLSHIETKAELTKYLSEKILNHFKNNTKKVLVTHHTTMMANCNLSEIITMPEMTHGQHTLEEGDQLVLLNAFDCMNKDPSANVDIFSVDTDVFILLTGSYPLLPPMTTFCRKRGEKIPIWECYNRLGKQISAALIGWYAFKGTDNTGTFAGKGVSAHFKALMKCDDEILDAFAVYGLTSEIPNWIFRQMERYVCILYSTSKIKANYVTDLRWMLFAQKGKEGQQLPPTMGTLRPHVERAYYMSIVWNSSCKPTPSIPPVTDYSWQLKDGHLKPVFCNNPPAPEALLEIRRCTCNGSCSTNRCSCKKNNLLCTDACECGDGCENTKDSNVELVDDIDELY